jgi:hypothetical protein
VSGCKVEHEYGPGREKCRACGGHGTVPCVCRECEDEHTYECRRCFGDGWVDCKCAVPA